MPRSFDFPSLNLKSFDLQIARFAGCVTLILLSGCHATNGWVMNNSGMGYYQKGNYSMARNEFQRAVIDRPRDPDHRHNLAMAMEKQGDTAGAEMVLRHNLSVDPMHQPTYHALAQILIAQNRTSEADHLLAGWKDSQPYVPEAYVEYAWFQHETGNRAGAEQTLRQALQVKPNHPVALAHLGQLYHETGQTDQAAAYYQRSLMSRWDQPQVRSRLATVSGSQNIRRSALMQNTPVTQTVGLVTIDGQPMVSQAAITSNDPILMQDPVIAQQPLPHRRHRHGASKKNSEQRLTAYPLPEFGMADAGIQSSVVMTSAPNQAAYPTEPPIITESLIAPQTAMIPPVSGPTPMSDAAPGSQADPAHSTEMTAGLPVVDPY